MHKAVLLLSLNSLDFHKVEKNISGKLFVNHLPPNLEESDMIWLNIGS